jgi:glycosyltransferase involved in cell wall biosynthesis
MTMNGSAQSGPPLQNTRPAQVSVVIPAYNSAEYIAETLDSVLAQTFSDYEVIVVNDGSPDTHLLEQALAPYQQRIRYIRQENRGPSAARNAAILEASGKYVAFLDSDDRWLPSHLEAQLRLFEKDPTLGLVYADGIVTVEGAPVRTCFQINRQHRPVTFESLVREDCTVVTSATVARREALLEAGLFDERFRHCEDFDLWARILLCGFRIDYACQIQIVHRSGIGLSSDSESMKRSLLAVYQKMASQPPLSETRRQLVMARQNRAEGDLQLALCKKAILAGDLPQALRSAESAAKVLNTRRLSFLVLALRVAPRLCAAFYPLYVRNLARRNRARLKRLRDSFPSRVRNADLNSATAQPNLPHLQATPNETPAGGVTVNSHKEVASPYQ